MKKALGRFSLFGGLILLSALLYVLHYIIFSDLEHIGYFLFSDLAFLPLEVLIVGLIFDRLLEERQRKDLHKKLNMLIGVFFSEIGNDLLCLLCQNDRNLDRIKPALLYRMDWKKKEFKEALSASEAHRPQIMLSDLARLKSILVGKRSFLINIMEYPILLEHELFSEIMVAIFHLEEELSSQKLLEDMTEEDREDIGADILRVYGLLMRKWILYMWHLSEEYPYLYSFSVRTNPLQNETAGA